MGDPKTHTVPDLPWKHCPVCGWDMEGRQCKRLCARCGYREDCSDLVYDNYVDDEGDEG